MFKQRHLASALSFQLSAFFLRTRLSTSYVPRSLLFLLLISALSFHPSALLQADTANRWEFDNTGEYEVSDPTLIKANPAGGGRAELILQETLRDNSSISQYLTDTDFSGLRIGSEQVLELAQDSGGQYVTPGIYRSRVIDKKAGSASWSALFSRISNALLANSPSGWLGSENGLRRLYRFDNDVLDTVSGDALVPVGGSVPFETDAQVGTHAARFQGVKSPSLVLPRSQLDLSGSTGFTYSFWVYPMDPPLTYDYSAYLGYAGSGGRLYYGYFLRTDPYMKLQFRDGAGGINEIFDVPPMPLETWTFVTITWDVTGRHLNLFFNKNIVFSSPLQSSGNFVQVGDLTIGRDQGGVVNARIDDFTVWDRALSQDEISSYIDGLRAVQFRLRSSPTADVVGDFSGPDGTASTAYLGVGESLAQAGNFNPIHRYLQYELFMFTDSQRLLTPQAEYTKFTLADGTVFTDSTEGDFERGSNIQNMARAPAVSHTPYFAIARNLNGGYLTSGTYRSAPIDSGSAVAVWERLRWRLPQGIQNDDSGLFALYHMDGTWVDVAPEGGSFTPTVQNNTAYSSSSRLGFGAGVFDPDTGGSTISGFFSSAHSLSTMTFWIRPNMISGGVLDVGGGQICLHDRQLVAEEYGANSPIIYINANPQDAYIRPGWNHVAIVWPSAIDAQDLRVGIAGSEVLNALLDELALYDISLSSGQVRVQLLSAFPVSSGFPSLRVRVANNVTDLASAPWSSSFTDPLTANFIFPGRYLQYEISMTGDADGTPALGDVVAYGNDGVSTFEFSPNSFSEVSLGEFIGNSIAWYGDQITVEDYAATDPSDLTPGDFVPLDVLAGLWHLDERIWDFSTVLQDSSGRGRNAAPVNGAQSSPVARVGLRSGQFDGVDQYVQLGQITELAGTDFSVGLWFKSSDTGEGALMSTYADGSGYFELTLNHDGTQVATGKVAFVINDRVNGVKAAVSPAANFNNGTWHYVAGVRAGSYIHLYVDGTRVASTAIGAYGLLPSGSPRIMRNGNGINYLSGFVDEVIAFGSALSPKQVGTVFASGYSTVRINEMTFAPVDAGGPTIWQTLRWTTDGIYGTQLSPAVGVTGLWHLDETAGGTAVDSSGGGFDAVLTGTTSVQGTFGAGRYLNGSGDHLRVPHTFQLESGVFSIELWVKPEALSSRTFVDKSSGGNGYSLFSNPSGFMTFQLSGSSVVDSLPLLQNVWQHIVATFDGTTMRLYVNGELRGAIDPVGLGAAPTVSGSDFYIGRASGGGQFVRGTVDEVGYHARRLLDTEILDHYRAYAGTLKFQVRAGDTLPLDGETFYGPDGTSGSYFKVLEDNNLQSVVPLVRYLQVKAYIGTEDHRFSPTFYGLSVSASRYPENAPWISPTEVAGYSFFGKLLGFNHDRTFNVDTDVRYQVSGDVGFGTSNQWFYYDSNDNRWMAQGATNLDVYAFQTSSKDVVSANIAKFYEQVYDKTGGVFRFKAFLKSAGDKQISVDWVDVAASEGRVVVEVPNGEEVGPDAWVSAIPYDIEWSWAGNVSDNLAIEYSLDGYTGPWVTIVNGLAAGAGGSGVYTWQIPGSENPNFKGLNSNVVIQIRDLNDDSITDTSDSPFEIIQDFKLRIPNGGEYWYIGDTNVIQWEASFDLPVKVSLYMAPDGSNYYANAGGYLINFQADSDDASGSNTYSWVTRNDVPLLLTTNGRIRVQEPTVGVARYADESDGVFTMAGLVITSPTEGQKVKRNDPDGFDIEWTTIGAGSNVTIDISLDSGVTWEADLYTGVTNAPGANTHNWFVTHPESDFAMLRIRSLSDGKVVGYSKVFTIAGIDVTAPDGGEEWLMGTTNRIEWVAGGAGEFVSIYYTDLYGGLGTNTEWTLIQASAPNMLSYDWIVSDRVSPNARIKIVSDEDPNLFSVSQFDFNIAGVRVTYPNLLSDLVTMGVEELMTHNGAPLNWKSVQLDISYDEQNTWQPLGLGSDRWPMGGAFPFTTTYPSRKTKVRATAVNATLPDGVTPLANIFDVSDDYFTSAGLLLNGAFDGSTNTLGQTYQVEWVTAGAGETVDISYSSPATSGQQMIIQGAYNDNNYPGDNSYPWTVPTTAVPTEDAVLQIVSGPFTNRSAKFILRGVRVLQPIAGDMWDVGSQHDLSWQRAGMNQDALGTISLSLDGGSTYVQNIVTNLALISVPFQSWDIDPELTPTTNAVIRLHIDSSGTPADVGMEFYSDAFTLRGIKILAPLQGVTVLLGVTNRIEFVAAGVGDKATILYSPDGGAHYDTEPIVVDLPIAVGTTAYDWGVEFDRTPSTNAVVKIVGNNVVAGSSAHSKTSGAFTLGGIRVDRPIQFDIWAVGEMNLISYISVGTLGLADLHLVYEDGHEEPVNNGNPLSGSTDGSVTTLSTWTLPDAAARGLPAVSNVVLRVRDRDPSGITGYSDSFKIVRQARIEIVAPLEGDYLKVGEEAEITWVRGGYMEATDFKVFYSRNNFVTMDEIISRDPTYNPTNNTFVKVWPVPDKLGPVQILVTNTVAARSSVFDYSGTFDIVGDLNLVYPNGNASDEPIYAKSKIQARWLTLGSVSHVNLLYQHDASDWIQLNTTPIPNNGGSERLQTTYLLEMPDVVTETMRFRVQDDNYTQTFDGINPGPYDDLDNPFSVGYYTILWEVGYYEDGDESGPFLYTDNLSVTDSSGWSESGLTSADADGNLVYIEHHYPYGIFDTVWYRQFFNDTVDFRWICSSNQTRRVALSSSDTEPDAHVLANFVYSPSTNQLTIHSWIERGGRILHNPDSTRVTIYDTAGDEVDVQPPLLSYDVLADGFFRLIWSDVAVEAGETPGPGQLVKGGTYLARVEVVFNGVSFTAAVTYTLSLAPEYEQISILGSQITALEATLTNQVGALAQTTEDFRDDAIGRLDSLTNQVGGIESGVTNLSKQITSFSNTVISSQAMISNQLVDVISPAVSNISSVVSNISDSTSGDQARILNRPTTVTYGSTNTILYKTTRGLDIGQVTVSVEGESGSTVTMREMSDGIGIYSYDLIADWGLGSYTITCKGPLNPLVSDSIVIEVVSGVSAVSSFSDTLSGIESQITGMSSILSGVGGIQAGLADIAASIANTAGSGSGSGGSTEGVSADSLYGTDGSGSALIGQLSSMSSQINEIYGSSSSASKFALSAKNEAGSAVSAIRELKELLASGGGSDEVNSALDSVRSSIDAANANISDIPKAMGATDLHAQIGEVAKQISELASREGYDYNVGQQALGAGGEGDAADEEMITVLNANMSEVKISLEFMKKILDEKINEPVVQVDYIGVE